MRQLIDQRIRKALIQIESARHLLNRELSADSIDETRVNELTRLLIDLNATFVDLVRSYLKTASAKTSVSDAVQFLDLLLESDQDTVHDLLINHGETVLENLKRVI